MEILGKKIEKYDAKNHLDYSESHLLHEWSDIIHFLQKHRCSICKKESCYCDAHHIFPKEDYPDYKYDLWNGLLLCISCHRYAHSIYNACLFPEYLEKLTKLVKEGKP
jgi:5-methylcytosine-specific restriction endonuclease McrA